MKYIQKPLLYTAIGCLLFSCRNTTGDTAATDTIVIEKKQQPATDDSAAIAAVSKQILRLLKSKDHNKLAAFIHPAEGLRFSPYGYIDTSTDVQLSVSQFTALAADTTNKIRWGYFDGSGDNILMTAKDYFSKFVYDTDFIQAPQQGIDTVFNSGNSLNNIAAIYTESHFIEYYFPGFEEKFAGMDWKSLKLVFRKYNNNFYLVGIVHNQWTI